MVLGFLNLPPAKMPHKFTSSGMRVLVRVLTAARSVPSTSQNKNIRENSYLFLLRSMIIVISRLAEIAQQRTLFGRLGSLGNAQKTQALFFPLR